MKAHAYLNQKKNLKKFLDNREAKNMEEKETPRPPKPILEEYKWVPPFPSWLRSMKCERENQDIMDTFGKVVVNIPLLEIIKHIPRYDKFIKKLCVSKKKNEN